MTDPSGQPAALVDTVERGESFSLRIVRRGDDPVAPLIAAFSNPAPFFEARVKKRSKKKDRRRQRRKRLVGSGKIVIAGESKQVFVKLYRIRTVKDWFEELLFGKRAVRALRAGVEAEARGILVPKHLAASYRGGGRLGARMPGESLLLMLALPTRRDVRDTLKHDFPRPGKSRNAFLRSIGVCCGDLHRRGLAHGDLKAGNLIVLRRDRPEFALLDLDRTTFRRPDRTGLDLKDAIDLYRLLQSLRKDTSPRERLRVLAAYRRSRRLKVSWRRSPFVVIVARHAR